MKREDSQQVHPAILCHEKQLKVRARIKAKNLFHLGDGDDAKRKYLKNLFFQLNFRCCAAALIHLSAGSIE